MIEERNHSKQESTNPQALVPEVSRARHYRLNRSNRPDMAQNCCRSWYASHNATSGIAKPFCSLCIRGSGRSGHIWKSKLKPWPAMSMRKLFCKSYLCSSSRALKQQNRAMPKKEVAKPDCLSALYMNNICWWTVRTIFDCQRQICSHKKSYRWLETI